jgi:beta-glucanase (GH16 family)
MMVLVFVPIQLIAAPMDWVLAWSDECNAANGTGADTTKWTYETGGGGFGNGELEYYTNRTVNVFHRDGNLVIKAIKEAYSGSNYTSGRIKTYNHYDFTFGKVEMRGILPQATQGIWPAFWMLGSSISLIAWPTCGEMDIMEFIGKDPTHTFGTFHGPGYSGGSGDGSPVVLTNPQNYHIWSIIWERDIVTWYLDGVQYHQLTAAEIVARGLGYVGNHDFFILLNMAVGGAWPGNPDATSVFPQEYVIDYVRVYKREADIPVIKTLPARIEAEDYINKSYVEGNLLRENCNEGALDVGFVRVNNWMEYTVNVPATAAYQFTCRTAGAAPTGTIQLQVGGTTLGSVTPTATADWQTWATTAPATVNLTAGQQTVRIFFNGTGYNFNYFDLTSGGPLPTATPTPPPGPTPTPGPTATPAPTPTPAPTATPTPTPTTPPANKVLPGKIEAETYDAMSGVQTEATSDTGGGLNVGWIDLNDWMDYYTNVQQAGAYRIDYRVASPNATGKVDFRVNGTTLATTTIPNTGGWQAWTTVSANVTLSAGTQTIRLFANVGGWNINWFQGTVGGVTSTPTTTPTTTPPITPTPTPTAPPGGSLLSQGKAATASSFQAGNEVAKGNDGSTSTRWAASGATFPQWWKVDLGAGYNLSRVDINWYSSATRSFKYKIEVSTDNVTFTTVVDKTGNTATGNTSDSFSATGRYVRITITGASAGWASAYEFKVYGN